MTSPRLTLPILGAALLLVAPTWAVAGLADLDHLVVLPFEDRLDVHFPSKAPPTAGADAAYGHAARAVPLIADDYARALAEARARKVPIFIEAWAPW